MRCIDEQNTQYVVEMQLFNVAGFEERIIYNASKAFTLQLKIAEDYHKLKGATKKYQSAAGVRHDARRSRLRRRHIPLYHRRPGAPLWRQGP